MFDTFVNQKAIATNADFAETKLTDYTSLYLNSDSTQAYYLTYGKLYFPQSCSEMFKDRRKLTSIEFNNVDTSNVTNMDYMFDGCSGFTTIYVGDL